MDEASANRKNQTGRSLKLHRQLDKHRALNHVAGRQTPGDADMQTRAQPDVLNAWCISKGMAGMNSQTSGLAKAAGFEFEFRDAQLGFPWNCMPTSLVPRSPFVLRDASTLAGEPPRLVVSCGRHGIVPALTMKKRHQDRVFTVHIQDPKIDTSGFDLVVIPRHDRTRGPNVYLTTGALHYVTPERLQNEAAGPIGNLLTPDNRPLVTVLLGGKNGCYAFSQSDVERLIEYLNQVVAEHDVRLAILKSNRTDTAIVHRMEREFGHKHFVWNEQCPNPYFAGLAKSSHVIVTGDSVSMVTEALVTGRPVYVHHLTETRPARRFRRFHEMFEEAGYTRPFAGRLAKWSYEPPNDTPRVAGLIRERMGIQ